MVTTELVATSFSILRTLQFYYLFFPFELLSSLLLVCEFIDVILFVQMKIINWREHLLFMSIVLSKEWVVLTFILLFYTNWSWLLYRKYELFGWWNQNVQMDSIDFENEMIHLYWNDVEMTRSWFDSSLECMNNSFLMNKK